MVADNKAPPYKPGLNSAGTDALYLSFALRPRNGWGGKISGFRRGKIFIIAFHFVLSHYEILVFGFFAVCRPFRAFFTASVKKQLWTLAPESAMYSRCNRRCTLSPILGIFDRCQDADHLHGPPALWARELSRQLGLFDQIVTRHIAEQQLEL